jgi:hypothetical protein
MHERGILTIAFGEERYIELAKSLARSIDRFSPGISKAVVTDRPESDLGQYYDHVIALQPERGRDVKQKLFIDLYTPFRRTLFIDSDSLVFGSLEFAFKAFAGGRSVIQDRTFKISFDFPHGTDFHQLSRKTGFNSIPGFNGGVYYVEPGTPSVEIFERARVIVEDFPAYGLREFREGGNCPGDELVIGLCLAERNTPTVKMDRLLMEAPFGLEGKLELDAVRGKVDFVRYGERVQPVIIHFCGSFREMAEYEREQRKLVILSHHGAIGPLLAYLFEAGFDARRGTARMMSAAWRMLPDRVRLLSYGVQNRFRKVFRPITRAKSARARD